MQDMLGLQVCGSSLGLRNAVMAAYGTFSVLPQFLAVACNLFVPYRSLSRERVLFVSDFSTIVDTNGNNTFWLNKRNA